MLIQAAHMLDGPAFAVAGDGPLRRDLADLAARYGNRVRFVGTVDDIAALMGLARCVVCTSAWEGLPLTLLEALSLGTPVVATAVDGVTDVVPRDAALLVEPDDPAAISAAISRILASEQLAEELRRKALAAAPTWRPETMLARYRSAYLSALAGAPGWSGP